MAKRSTAALRSLKPDPRFGSVLVSAFINSLMQRGKRTEAQQVFYQAMDRIKRRVRDVNELEVFTGAIDNIKPKIEVLSERVGGATYEVPMQWKGELWQSVGLRGIRP